MDLKKVMEDKIAAFAEAYKRGDATGCAAIYSEDAFQLAPNQPMLRGKQAIKEFFQGVIDQVGGTLSTQIVEFGVEGDLAYQMGTVTFTGTKTPDQGKFVHIFRRQQDGSWKMHVAIFNSDKPL
jgi:uncharacterized protein (TIGR02246 family)